MKDGVIKVYHINQNPGAFTRACFMGLIFTTIYGLSCEVARLKKENKELKEKCQKGE